MPTEAGDTETAYAKINLALHVRARRENGYHDIETLFAFVDGGDHLTIAPSDVLELRISGPFGEGLPVQGNLVLNAAKTLRQQGGGAQGAMITLTKNLPVASGIGGGSADAAAALRLLNRYWQLGLGLNDLAKLSEPLGADIPACVFSTTMFGRGTGADLSKIEADGLQGKAVLLVNPRHEVSTAQIFARWNGHDDGALLSGNPLEASLAGCNGLQNAAEKLCPAIARIDKALAATAPLLSRMSGSGATCFGIYESDMARDEAQAKLAQLFPECWMMAGAIK